MPKQNIIAVHPDANSDPPVAAMMVRWCLTARLCIMFVRQVVAVLQSTEHHTFPVTDDLATAMRAKADFQLEVGTGFLQRRYCEGQSSAAEL